MGNTLTLNSGAQRRRVSTKGIKAGAVIDLFHKIEPVEVPTRQPGRVAQLSQEEARILTTNIKHAVVRLWVLVQEAHDRGAWTALGYETWRDYVVQELQMSESTSYNYLDQARIMRELVAAGVDPNAMEPPSVRVVQRIKDNPRGVRAAAKKALADGISVEDALRNLADEMTPREPARPARTVETPTPEPRVIEGEVVSRGPIIPAAEPTAPRPPAPALVFSAEERVEAVKAEMKRGEVLCPACDGVGHVPRKLAQAIGPALEELRE